VASLATTLARRGHLVEVHTRRDGLELPDVVRYAPGVDVVHVPAGPPTVIDKDELWPLMPAFGDWLADRWWSDPPDIVHAHFWMSGSAAVRAARRRRIPVVQTFHALGSVKRRHQGSRDTSPSDRIAVETWLAATVDRVVATCSDEVAELVRLGAPAERMTVVPCGVDLSAFRPDQPRMRALVRPATGYGDRRPRHRLLCLGRLVERKGIDTVIAALARVPDTELVIAGGPPAAEIVLDEDCRRLTRVAAEHGVLDRVLLVGGVERCQVPALIRSADAVVCVPWYEPFGITPVEAMACGVPVVASAVGGMLDTVLDGVTGVHVPPRDPDRLVRVLSDLLADPERCRTLGNNGSHRAQRYSWADVAAETEAVYRALAGGSAGLQPATAAGGERAEDVAGGPS